MPIGKYKKTGTHKENLSSSLRKFYRTDIGIKRRKDMAEQSKKRMIGSKQSLSTKLKKSKSMKKNGHKPPISHYWLGKNLPHMEGEKNYFWKGGSLKYFTKFVKSRDNYTCRICGLKDPEIMEVDHIKPQADYPQLGKVTGNLITICPNCHRRKTNKELRDRNTKKKK